MIAALALLAPFINTRVCYANPLPPPSITVIVPNAPESMSIVLKPLNLVADRWDRVVEGHFTFYSFDFITQPAIYTLEVTTRDQKFEVSLNEPPQRYETVYTLSLENRTLTPGKLPYRSIALLSFRVLVTIAIEGIVLLLFGYRSRRSWLTLAAVNLITAGLLNLWLLIYNINYPFASLTIAEIIILVVEMTAFLIFVKEHSRLRTVIYMLAANLLSFVAGTYLFIVLPL